MLPENNDIENPPHDHGRILPRMSVLWQSLVHIGEFTFACQIRNLSNGGVKIKVDAPLQCGSLCTLEIPKYSLILGANIIWTTKGFAGLHFLDDEKLIRSEFIRSATVKGIDPITFINVMR